MSANILDNSRAKVLSDIIQNHKPDYHHKSPDYPKDVFVSISSDAFLQQRINNKKLTEMRIEKDQETGIFMYKFIDKVTHEVVFQIPSTEKISQIHRIDNFLAKVARDL